MKYHGSLLFAAALLLTYPSHAVPQQEKQKQPIPIGERGVDQSARAYFDQGRVFLNKRDLDSAISAFTKAAEIDPKFADAIIYRGMARWVKQDLEGALTDYGHAIEIAPNNPEPYFRRALALEQTQPERAIADYGKAIELDPKSIGSYFNRSRLLKNRGDFRGAKADLDAAIALEPGNPIGYNSRGILHWEAGNSRDALIDLDRSIELQSNVTGGSTIALPIINPQQGGNAKAFPGNILAVMYLTRGFIKASLGELPAAYKDIDQAFQLDPNLWNGRRVPPLIIDHYTEQGAQLANIGELDKAMIELNKAIVLGGFVGQTYSPQVGPYGKPLALARGNRGLIWLRKGNEAEAQKDFTESLKLDPSAGSWIQEKINSSGLHFSLGPVVPRQAKAESSDAVIALLKAAEQGDPSAQYNLGMAYVQGRGVTQNPAEALIWLRKAAEQDHADAQHSLGVMYQQGMGVREDYEEALKWYRKAAEKGQSIALNNLGLMYATGSGVPQDYAEAVKWIRKAAEKGYVRAQSNLGKLYSQGKGIAQDKTEAAKWYRLAAEQGEASAQYNLGIMYFEGQGVPQDYKEAARLYRAAAEQGYVNAQHDVGVMYQAGVGVPQDYVQAYFWLNLSAAALKGKDQEETLKLLNTIAEKMTPQQIKEAERLRREWPQ